MILRLIPKLVILLFILFIFVIPLSYAEYVGDWRCQLFENDKPWGQAVQKIITHVKDNKYKVKIGNERASNYILNGFLRQDDDPKYGILLKDGKLFSVTEKDGKPEVPNMYVKCLRVDDESRVPKHSQ